MVFKTITHSTNQILRAELLEKADQIAYICVTADEIKKLNEPIEIGLTNKHHEYNRIQSGKHRNKTINITFNKEAPMCLTHTFKSDKESEMTMTTFVDKADKLDGKKNYIFFLQLT